MTRITDPSKAAEALKNAVGESAILSLTPAQLIAVSTAMHAKASKYRTSATSMTTMVTGVGTDAATFIDTHGPASVYNDTIDALKNAGTTFGTTLNTVADSMDNDADGMAWFAQNQQTINDEGKDKFNGIGEGQPDGTPTVQTVSNPSVTSPSESTPKVQPASNIMGGFSQGPYDNTGPVPVYPGVGRPAQSPYDTESTQELPVYDPTTGPYPRPT